jgi:S1-C subfamily serine protease
MTSTNNRIARYVGFLLAFATLALSAPSGAVDSPADASKPLVKDAPPVSLHLPPLGLRIRDMSVMERAELKLNQGVMVVVAVGASAIAGVREDDIILAVDKKPVTGTEQFWLLVDAAKWKCTLQILRKDKRIEVAIGAKDG